MLLCSVSTIAAVSAVALDDALIQRLAGRSSNGAETETPPSPSPSPLLQPPDLQPPDWSKLLDEQAKTQQLLDVLAAKVSLLRPLASLGLASHLSVI